jgi:hypothetical protein
MDVVLLGHIAGSGRRSPGPRKVCWLHALLLTSNANHNSSFVFVEFRKDLLGAARISSGQSTSYLPKTIPTYLGLLIFAFVYQLILVYDGLAAKNTIQIIGLCLMNLAILVYTAIQFDQIFDAADSLLKLRFLTPNYWPTVKPYLIALPIVVGVSTMFLGFVAWKLYGEFAWTIYKQISADLRMKRRFLVYQVSFRSRLLQYALSKFRLDLYCPSQIRLFPLPWL